MCSHQTNKGDTSFLLLSHINPLTKNVRINLKGSASEFNFQFRYIKNIYNLKKFEKLYDFLSNYI